MNFFFGTIVNGAYGLARTVQSFVEVFTVNFDSAAAPQITQSVGGGDIDRASSLAKRVCRLSQLLSLLIVFPLFAEMDFVLDVWLDEVPDNTVLFCRVMLIAILIASTGGGLLRLKDALGKIKYFMLTYSFWYIITLPVGYYLFKAGMPPVTILVLFVITDIICRITQLVLMKLVYDYDILSFCKEAYSRPFIIAVLMVGYLSLYRCVAFENGWLHLSGLVLTFLIGLSLVWSIGMKGQERASVSGLIRDLFMSRN